MQRTAMADKAIVSTPFGMIVYILAPHIVFLL